jgi:ferredoxin
MDAAACIGCGACVAACPNGSAMLFTAAKVTHLGLLPQGQPERQRDRAQPLPRCRRLVGDDQLVGVGLLGEALQVVATSAGVPTAA